MRRALAPRSLRPTRETDRMSTWLPPGAGVTRTTMSSLKPNHRVVAVPRAGLRRAPRRPSPSPARGRPPRRGRGRGPAAPGGAPGRCPDSPASAGPRPRARHTPRRWRPLAHRAQGGELGRALGVRGDVVDVRQGSGGAAHVEGHRGGAGGDEEREDGARHAGPGSAAEPQDQGDGGDDEDRDRHVHRHFQDRECGAEAPHAEPVAQTGRAEDDRTQDRQHEHCASRAA